ncbi:MAG: hypothetical protein A2X86_03060 [Bdellovibrionales bacterium GWA2_49_15]|nr:MAG: hypothetical protein A2X86_03060 [Bdellovibrionales bacterium GWA2_49_15]HAZ12193.1 hypothetical protein [Bdellovibrionales bacterium]
MNFRLLYCLVALASTNLLASTRTCDPSGSVQTAKIDICYINPIVQTNTSDDLPKCHDNPTPLKQKSNLAAPEKKPFLFYYVLDSKEPFMQASVDYELKKLRQNCIPGVNWVAVINGHYMDDAIKGQPFQLTFCKEGIVERRPLPLELFYSLETKRKSIARGLPDEERHLFRFLLRIPPQAAGAFSHFPLAHPEFFVLLFEHVRGEIFPPGEFTPFIHTKSHGSVEMTLTGLTETSTEEKRACQLRTLDEHRPALRVEDILASAGSIVGLGTIQDDLDEIFRGSSLGAKNQNPSSGLGENQLGENQLGVQEGVGGPNGLGTTTGLQAENKFGLFHTSLGQMMGYLTRISPYKSEIAFWMLESCESGINEKQSVAHAQIGIQGLKAIYSASGSLWYRNLDWHEMLKSSGKSSGQLQERVLEETSLIPNYIFSEDKK